ncbi:MAG: hypothetical protein IKN54_02645 [Lachnospiraceae bacterium]|nr:hypothetical protein [Lachnospiraceae bacterium]
MKLMAESEKFQILYEYEKVFLKIKSDSRLILIGDFYGDPESAVISEDEKCCAIVGEGLIVYFLHEPFDEYNSDSNKASQWCTWGRENEIVWINKIEKCDSQEIIIQLEDMRLVSIKIDELLNK